MNIDRLKSIPDNLFPRHIALIPDGNRRWANMHGLQSVEGHMKGAGRIMEIVRDLENVKGVRIITFWGFSSDNWKRSKEESNAIFHLIGKQLDAMLPKLISQNARFVHLGRKDRIPGSLNKTIRAAERKTKRNNGKIICIAIDFGGEDQEMRLLQEMKKLPPNTVVDRELLWKLRDGHGLIPPVDLLIRTAGEKRTSDIGWLNGAPTGLYFLDKFMPDVTSIDIIDAIVEFSRRERRMGGNTV